MDKREAEEKLLKEVESLGLKRQIEHIRHKEPVNLTPRVQVSDETIATLWMKNEDGNYELVSTGVAQCSSKDQFCKAKGRLISTARALSEYKELRRQFEEFKKQGGE